MTSVKRARILSPLLGNISPLDMWKQKRPTQKPRERGSSKGCSLLHQISALKANNQSLATALDEARKTIRKGQDEYLKIQKERQELFEKVAELEQRLQLTKLATTNLLDEAQEKIQQASSVLHSESKLPILQIKTSPKIFCDMQTPHIVSTEPQHVSTSTPIGLGKQVLPLSPSSCFARAESLIQELSPLEGTQPEQTGSPPNLPECSEGYAESDESLDLLSGLPLLRPRRKCTSLSTSYQEPKINRKLRRGDPFTTSFTNWSPPDPKAAKTKPKAKRRSSAGIEHRVALMDMTNKVQK